MSDEYKEERNEYIKKVEEEKRMMFEDEDAFVTSLVLDKRLINGFFTRNEKEVRKFGTQIVGSGIISDVLSNETINDVIADCKEDFEDWDEKRLLYTAACDTLRAFLALTRVNYLVHENIEKGE